MMRALRRHSTAIQTIAVVGICAVVLATAVFSKPRAGHWCPCGVGAAFVAATGSTITAFTLAQVTELYLVLWQGFAAIHSQINANTGANQETMSYQTQAVAHVHRQRMAYRQTMDSMRPATIGFQMSASSGAAGAELNTDLVRDAIHEENYQWRTNLDEATAGSNEGNAAYAVNARLQKYCNQRDAALGLCELPAEPRHINGDVDADTLYSQTTLDEAMLQPAIDRCRLLSGMPTQAPRNIDFASQDGPESRVAREVGNARAMLSFAMCDYLVATRTELPEESLRAWAEEVVKRITGGVGMPPPPSSCRPGGGAGGGPRINASCTPFPQGYEYGGRPLSPSQVDTLNLVYSVARSSGPNGEEGLSHNAALAVALTVMHETSGGRSMIEQRRALDGSGSCNTELRENVPQCRATRNADAGERNDCAPSGSCYKPTGVGWIQWSGWQQDGWGGEGTELQRTGDNPNTGQPWRKCDLVYAPSVPGNCTSSEAEAIQNNASAVSARIHTIANSHPDLRNPAVTGQRAASIVTHKWIKPRYTDRPARIASIANKIDGSGGLPDGTCSGTPMASAPPSGGTGPVVPNTPLSPTPIVHAPPSAPSNSQLSSVPGRPITVALQNPMQASSQNDCFGWRAKRKDRHGNPNPTFHRGVDLISSNRTIYAAADGIVVDVVNNCSGSDFCGGAFGNYIIIEHADGSRTQYSHNAYNTAQVRRNDRVFAGQPIAQMGGTGGRYGDHLDFMVHTPDGHAVNPHAVVSGLPNNTCGTGMGTQEKLAQLSDRSTEIELDGTLQSSPGGGVYADGGGGNPFNSGCSYETADLGLNLDAEHISHLELMKLVSEYRFKDPGWVEFVNGSANRAQLIRDYNAIHATKLYMNWQSYEQQLKVTGLIAAWAATEAQRSYTVSTGE